MKATYTVRPGLAVEVQAEDQPGLFAELSSAAEVFGESCCGCCGDTEIVPVFRTRTKGTKIFHFAEWRCRAVGCGAYLALGQRTDDKRYFPKRRLDTNGRPDMDKGTLGSTNGWTKYAGPRDEEDAPAANGGQTPPEGTRRPAATDHAPPQSWSGTRDATPPPAQDARTDYTPPQGTAPPTVGHHITPAQWAQIHDALQKHGVCDNAFLERHTYGSPRDILVAHFPEALAAAVSPDKATREIDQAIKRGRRQTSNGVR